jgi:hypothetical protein
MNEAWDEVNDPKLPARTALFSPQPLHMVAGLFLGVISAVINPGLIMLLPFIWLIPAVIAALLWVIRSARSLATGFAAVSAAWLAFLVTFWLYTAFAQQ